MTSPHDGIQSDPHHHGVQEHGHHGPAPLALPYSDAEVARFRKDDVHAGKMIILLMGGIFTVGVFLYVLVALSTWPMVTT
jgi:hypothetical protein